MLSIALAVRKSELSCCVSQVIARLKVKGCQGLPCPATVNTHETFLQLALERVEFGLRLDYCSCSFLRTFDLMKGFCCLH